MGTKVKDGTEKTPSKRAYAKPKLRKFLIEKGIYKEFVENVKKQNYPRWNNNISMSFLWVHSNEGFVFWEMYEKEFLNEN